MDALALVLVLLVLCVVSSLPLWLLALLVLRQEMRRPPMAAPWPAMAFVEVRQRVIQLGLN